MHYRTLLFHLPVLLSLITGGTAAWDSMTKWEPGEGASAKDISDAKFKATWSARYRAADTGLQHPESFETNLALAKGHFDWLIANTVKADNLYSGNKWVLIAVMYDPLSQTHFASTVPRGPRGEIMQRGSVQAPKWYAAAKPPGRRIQLHAEDGVYFNYENSNVARLNTAPNIYPAGAVIAAYGHNNVPGSYREIPGMVASCSSDNSPSWDAKKPSCQLVANRLGVHHNDNPPALAALANDAAEEVDEYDDGFDYSQIDIDKMLCDEKNAPQRRDVVIKGRHVQLNARDACSNIPSSVSSSSPSSSPSNSPSITPKPSCTMQNEDPDEGITTEYCVCEQSRTLPLLTITPQVVRTSSCEYTSLPPKDTKRAVPAAETPPPPPPVPTITPTATLEERDLTITKDLGPATTDMKNCQVCTPVVINEDSCTSIENCIKQTGQVTIEAGRSSVHVGTLTGTALYTSVSSALEKICPTPTDSRFTSCQTDTVAIGNIPYVRDEYLAKDGDLLVTVESSKYNVTSIRNAMIMAAAAAAQQAAVGKNCYDQEYLVGFLAKRSWTSWLPAWLPGMSRRGDIIPPSRVTDTWCNTVGEYTEAPYT